MRKLILFFIVFGILLIVAYLLLSRPSQPTKTATSETLAAIQDPKTALVELEKTLEVTAEIRNYNYMDWIDETKAVLPLKGMQFTLGTINIKGLSQFNNISQDDLTSINVISLSPLLTESEKFFISHKFTKNIANTRTVTTDGQVASFSGYEKDDLKCVIKIDDQTDPFGNFVCGTIDTKQAALQQDFRSLFIGPKAKDSSITTFRVEKVTTDYALGSASGPIMGYMWIAKKSGTTWNIIWTGNDAPLCTTMEKAGIPKSIYETCVTE